ncbi:HAD family hydrolase [Pedosphaera parvula]|uniref:Haloacid dehalogenase domain protein hydrolase n=1 Tax=Pedosphaera parvula (strain Ellin514) TaxID=320771 RepID=B9XEY6_PEDPL|nr:HAD family hydrolase [Pedosphaera parvula]EEF61484.1 Haloacid dehalogenase domain protein hydrolase [Pedosphaera parvula Ellin514]
MHTSKSVVIFDIDGTLTETMHIDGHCFAQALAEVFAFTEVDTDWSHYQHATDAGILQELFALRKERLPTLEETLGFQQTFVRLLTDACQQSPFQAIAGASDLLLHLSATPNLRIALATGAWSCSARLKMSSAGLCFDHFPAASADDAVAREDIMKTAILRASAVPPAIAFVNKIYIGDGVWDARACRKLKIPFIGIGTGLHAERLIAEGAVQTFPDLTDRNSFLQTVHKLSL